MDSDLNTRKIVEYRSIEPVIKEDKNLTNRKIEIEIWEKKNAYFKEMLTFFSQLGISLFILIFCVIMLIKSNDPLTSDNLYFSVITFIVGFWLPHPAIIKKFSSIAENTNGSIFNKTFTKDITSDDENLDSETISLESPCNEKKEELTIAVPKKITKSLQDFDLIENSSIRKSSSDSDMKEKEKELQLVTYKQSSLFNTIIKQDDILKL